MKTLFLLLQTQTQAPAQGQPGAGASMWIFLLLMFVVMYFFMIRPQRKQQKELEAFQNSLRKGDKVIIGNSGIFGEIVEVDDRTALVRVDGDTKLRVAKQVLTKDTSDIQK
ncbi:MAG: preprotein translocase subunit YajC [Bacteroidales bacterium]|nr:preprotein translocase subunit YajC [Bacteroidales bacterium]